jgi:hypothetical protein
MPKEIAKCEGNGCILKDQCMRYLVKPKEIDTYINPDKKGKECSFYYPQLIHKDKIRF